MGHVGNGNLGDEAILSAVIARLHAMAPGVELVAFTSKPSDTAERHGVRSFPIGPGAELWGDGSQAAGARFGSSNLADRIGRIPWLKALLRPAVLAARGVATVLDDLRFSVSSFRRLRGVTLVVFAGSGQLNDAWGGPFGYPLSILRWSILARIRGAAVSFASVGAGPIDGILSRRFLKLALRLAAYRSFRDPSSLALCRQLGAPEPNLLVRDLAFSHPSLAATAPSVRSTSRLCIGINPLPFYGGGYWHVRDRSVYDGYVKAHAELALGLAGQGWRVVLFPTQVRVDPETIHDIVCAARAVDPEGASALEVATDIADVAGLLDALGRFDLVVATRYHGALLALASGVPTVAVVYHPKTRDLMEHMGLGPWCVDVAGVTGSALLDLVARMASQLPAVRASLSARCGRELAELLTQYDQLVRLARVNGGGAG